MKPGSDGMSTLSVGVDLIHTKNEDTPLRVDLNDNDPGVGRPNISILNGEVIPLSSITTHINGGETTYEAIQVSIRKRFNGRYGGRISYTLADSSGNYDGGANDLASLQVPTISGYNFDTGQFLGAPIDPGFSDPRGQNQPVSWHRDNNLVISGQVLLPKTSWRKSDGLILSGIYRLMDGDRFTILSNTGDDDVDFLPNGNRAPASGCYRQRSPTRGEGLAKNKGRHPEVPAPFRFQDFRPNEPARSSRSGRRTS